MNSGNSHHRNALPCNTVSQNPMGQRAMHEGGFRKNVLRNLLLKAGEIVSSIVTEIKGRHFELVQGQGLEHRFEKYLVSPAAPSIDVDQLKFFWTRCVAQDARFQQP
jgi:hypothetical protein